MTPFPAQAPSMPRQSFCFSPIFPALVMGGLKRLDKGAVKARHVHDSMIGADIALDQPVSDWLRVL